MDKWKKYISNGNREFSCNHFHLAKSNYELAIEHAEKLFSKSSDAAEAASALVVSYHNLADLYQQQGNFSTAREVLEKTHQIILRTLVSTPIESERHVPLLRASIKTYSALIVHKRCCFCAAQH